MIADALSALAVAAIPVADLTIGLGIPLLLALVALGAVFDSPGAAAREALRPDVARRAGVPLARVNAWGEAAEGIGYLAGPALAGLLLLLVGGFGTLWTSVVLFGLALVVTGADCPRPPVAEPAAADPYLRSVKEGLLYVLRDRTLRAVTLTAAVVWVFILPFETVVLNAFLQETGQVAAFGAILAAYAGGGIAGALGYGAIAHRLPTRATLVGALALAGLSLGAFALLPAAGVMIGLAFSAGIVTGPINPVCAVIIQSRTPERLRGRVIGSYTALALAAGPLGPAGLRAAGRRVRSGGRLPADRRRVRAGRRGGRGVPRAARARPAGEGTELPPDSTIRQAVEGSDRSYGCQPKISSKNASIAAHDRRSAAAWYAAPWSGALASGWVKACMAPLYLTSCQSTSGAARIASSKSRTCRPAPPGRRRRPSTSTLARILAASCGASVLSRPWKDTTPATSAPVLASSSAQKPPKQYPMTAIRSGSTSGWARSCSRPAWARARTSAGSA